MDDLRLLDTKEMATRLGKNVKTIQRWRKSGKLPAPAFTEKRKFYWTESQLLNWLFAAEVTLSDIQGHRT